MLPVNALNGYSKPAALVVAWLVVVGWAFYLKNLLHAAHAEIKAALEKVMALEMSVGLKVSPSTQPDDSSH